MFFTPGARGILQAGADGRSLAAVLIVEDHGDVIGQKHGLEFFARAVGETVVHEDDLFLDGRGLDGPKKFIDVRNFVVDGDDDGNGSRPPLTCGAVNGRCFQRCHTHHTKNRPAFPVHCSNHWLEADSQSAALPPRQAARPDVRFALPRSAAVQNVGSL